MKTLFLSVCLFMASLSAGAQTRYSQEMAQSQGKQWTHGKSWDYVNGLVAKSLLNLLSNINMQTGQAVIISGRKNMLTMPLIRMVLLRISKKGILTI